MGQRVKVGPGEEEAGRRPNSPWPKGAQSTGLVQVYLVWFGCGCVCVCEEALEQPGESCFSATEMSDEVMQETSLAATAVTLEGKAPVEKATIIHQHIGRREMTDVIIETIKPDPGTCDTLFDAPSRRTSNTFL